MTKNACEACINRTDCKLYNLYRRVVSATNIKRPRPAGRQAGYIVSKTIPALA